MTQKQTLWDPRRRVGKHWCHPPSSHQYKPSIALRRWSLGSSAATFTSSVEGPEPTLTEIPGNLRKAAGFPSPSATHPHPPWALSPLPPGSWLSSPRWLPLSSDRFAPSLGNQSLTGVDYPTPLRHVPKVTQPITAQIPLCSPASHRGTLETNLLNRSSLVRPRETAEPKYWRGERNLPGRHVS